MRTSAVIYITNFFLFDKLFTSIYKADSFIFVRNWWEEMHIMQSTGFYNLLLEVSIPCCNVWQNPFFRRVDISLLSVTQVADAIYFEIMVVALLVDPLMKTG